MKGFGMKNMLLSIAVSFALFAADRSNIPTLQIPRNKSEPMMVPQKDRISPRMVYSDRSESVQRRRHNVSPEDRPQVPDRFSFTSQRPDIHVEYFQQVLRDLKSFGKEIPSDLAKTVCDFVMLKRKESFMQEELDSALLAAEITKSQLRDIANRNDIYIHDIYAMIRTAQMRPVRLKKEDKPT